jgi:hypothetical protein
MTNELIKAVKSLITDIESMQLPTPNWFGHFSEGEEVEYDGFAVEWPNLAISLAAVKALLEPKTIEGELTKPGIPKPEGREWNPNLDWGLE